MNKLELNNLIFISNGKNPAGNELISNTVSESEKQNKR